MAARDAFVKESWVKAMEVRLVRDELEKCRKGEGANAMENCRWLAEKYAQMLQDNKVREDAACSADSVLTVLQLQGYKTIERA